MIKREIKFRAWDTQLKSFTYSGFGGKTFLLFIKRVNCKRYIINQFTGLKDKNGKEIYEGDIVQWKKSEQEHEDDYYYERRNISFNHGSFGFENWYTDENNKLTKELIHHSKHFNVPDLYYVKFDIIIIGNIYDNPEFLKL